MNGSLLGAVAFLLVAGSFATWYRRLRRVEIPEDRRGFVASWLLGAGLGAFALTQEPGWFGGVPAGLAVFGGLLGTALVFISPQRVAAGAIRVGESLRDFTAPDEHGDEFALASTAGKPVLLKFFRGHW